MNDNNDILNKKILKIIFSVKNDGIHKVITILGIKFSFKSNISEIYARLEQQNQKIAELSAELNKVNDKLKINDKLLKYFVDTIKYEIQRKIHNYSLENIDFENSKFSVIMPTYNRAFCICNAIDSLLDQTYQNFELLICDDGSNDNTEQIIFQKYSKELSDKKIRYFKLSTNQGVCSARNVGLKNANNEWIAYLDTDNIMEPFFLEYYANAIKQERVLTYTAKIHRTTEDIIGHAFDYNMLCEGNYIDIGVFVHHKNLISMYGDFDLNAKSLEDWDLIIRYTKDFPPYFIDEILLEYNNDKDSDRLSNSNLCYDAYFYIKEKVKVLKLNSDNTDSYQEVTIQTETIS